MIKLSTIIHTRKKAIDQDIEQFLSHHPSLGMFLCGVIMPALILGAVSVVCYAVMLPVSLLMGWI